jgi:DNA-binding MarR family transcriptional regulator
VSGSSASQTGGGRSVLPPLIHGRVRLLVLSALVAAESPLPFTELRKRWRLTDGTLSVHLSRLEQAGMISLEKRFVNKRPQTLVAMTAEGRRRFAAYVKDLKGIVPGLEA